jgi:heat shock protein HtpX
MGNQVRTVVLLGALSVLLVLAGGALGRGWLTAALVVALGVNVFSYWFSDRLVLAMSRARPVTPAEAPALTGAVAELARAAGLPLPRVYTYDSASPNAFATGRNPANAAVAVSTGLLKLLSPEELKGVLAHELSHIKDRDILVATIAATLATAITFLARMVQWAALFGDGRRDRQGGGFGLAGMLLMAVLAPLAAMLIQMAVSRGREFLADAEGAKITGNPLYLASALRRLEEGVRRVPLAGASPTTSHLFIVKPFTARGLAALFSTHPPLAERVARLEKMAGR